MRARELGTLANTKVRIEDVLEKIFHIEAPRDAGTWRVDCPLKYEHGSSGKSMRVYSDSNTAYCFSHQKQWTPVNLWMLHSGEKRYTKAAADLLDFFGVEYRKPTPEDRWNQLNAVVPEINKDKVRNAYFNRLSSHLDAYRQDRQYLDSVVEITSQSLEELNQLPGDSTYATLDDWINRSMIPMYDLWVENGWMTEDERQQYTS